MADANMGDSSLEHAYYLSAPPPGLSKERMNWYRNRMITLAVHDNRPLIDDLPVKFLLHANASQYSTRLLVQHMLKEYRHRNSRMYNVWRNNGKVKLVAVGTMPNDRATLFPLYRTAKHRHEELVKMCKNDERCRWTLRRRDGRGQLMREMDHRFICLG